MFLFQQVVQRAFQILRLKDNIPDPVRVVKGIGQLVLDEMRALGPTIAEEISASGNRDIIFQPEYLKCALDNLLEKEHVDYFLHTVLIGAETVENEIRTIQCADDEGLFTVSAKAFVDATGDANLSRLLVPHRSAGKSASLPADVRHRFPI